MHRSLRLTLLLVLSVTVLASPSTPVYAAANAVRIPNVTRWVRIFSELEYKLSEAVRQRNSQIVSKLLADDFEMRISAMPGNPIPRGAWIRQAITEPKLQSTLEQMAVHSYDKLAIVSYLWTVAPETQPDAVRQIYIVDIWRQVAGGWRLAIRYAAPGGNSHITIPAGTPTAPQFEKKE